jgi:ribosome biogenesis protein BMS1
VDALTDPCPLPSTLKKRGLNERERLLYAPMADVGGLLYDQDAVYIDIPDWKVNSQPVFFDLQSQAWVTNDGT